MVYGEPLTNSPAPRASVATVPDTLSVSLSGVEAPFQFVTVPFTTPPRVTAIPLNVGSSAPYVFVWFAIVPVKLAGVIVSTCAFGFTVAV